jgi:hypothetical protein
MIWQSSEEMTKALVKPMVQKKASVQTCCVKKIETLVKLTVQKKASVQACCGYSVLTFWLQKGFQAKSPESVKPMIAGALRRCNDVSAGWRLEFNGQ